MTKAQQSDLLALLREFIHKLENGKCVKRNGQRLRKGSVKNYTYLLILLASFSRKKNFLLRIIDLSRLNKADFNVEINYWKKFQKSFSDFLYDDCCHYDNYVSSIYKLFRSFLSYVYSEKGIDLFPVRKLFYVSPEEIPVIALNSEQLNLLTFDKVFENSLPLRLKKAKDIFVFGCITGLRISDLLSLNKTNLEYNYSDVHLVITSQKTRHYSRIKLPGFAITILNRYQYHKTLLPHLHPYTLNKYFREIALKAGWVNPVAKIRLKRGMPTEIRPGNQNEHFRFCDLITTHTMRRTAITNMLNMGMPEHLVRRISGHSQSSKEFFRYVQYSQAHIDKELDKVFEQMNSLKVFRYETKP